MAKQKTTKAIVRKMKSVKNCIRKKGCSIPDVSVMIIKTEIEKFEIFKKAA